MQQQEDLLQSRYAPPGRARHRSHKLVVSRCCYYDSTLSTANVNPISGQLRLRSRPTGPGRRDRRQEKAGPT